MPRVVRQSVELLASAVATYVFVSTISVYADLSVPYDEDGPLATLDGEAEEITEGSYGPLKALCERVVTDTFGDRCAVVRPGFVVGPHDHTGRFTWWVHRAARGGVLPVPESIARRIQMIDARDLGAFVVRAATEPLHGVFNATGPVPPISMVDVVEAAAAAARVELSVAVVPDAAATALGLGFNDLPLWLDDPEWAAWAEVDVSRAVGAGLSFRPLADTVAATLQEAAVVDGWGLSEERERELLRPRPAARTRFAAAYDGAARPAASIAARASASSSTPGRPLTPTAPIRRPPSSAATPPRKKEYCGSKLASSVGVLPTLSASSRVVKASLRAAVYALRRAFS